MDNLNVDFDMLDSVSQDIPEEDTKPVREDKPVGPIMAPLSFSDLDAAAPKIVDPDAEEKEGPSAGQLIKDAVTAEWTLSAIARAEFATEPDPNFHMSKEFLDEVTEGLPEDYWGEFKDVVSVDHAKALSSKLHEDFDREVRFSEAGGWGPVARIGAAVLDPGAAALTLVTGGLAAPLVYGAKATRGARALRLGTIAAAENVLVDSVVLSQDPTASKYDLLYSAFGGMALGSLVGSLSKGNIDPDIIHLDNVAQQAQREIEEKALGQSVGAAQATPVLRDSELTPRQEALTDSTWEAPRTAGGSLRFDSVGQLKSSDNGLSRETGALLGEDAIGNADHSVNQFAATEYQALEHRTAQVQFYQKVVNTHFEDYAKENNLTNMLSRNKAQNGFYEEVTQAVRHDSTMVSPQAQAAAKDVADQFEDLLLMAQEAGVKGFENVKTNRNYVPRMYDGQKISMLIERYGHGQIRELIQGAIKKVQPEISDEIAAKISKWHLKKIRKHDANIDLATMRGLSGEDQNALKQLLVEDKVLTEVEVDDYLKLLNKPEQGGHSRSKQRLHMDELFTANLINKDGMQESVSLDSMLNNNIDDLFNNYSRQITGASAMAKAGFKSVGEFEVRLNDIKNAALDLEGTTNSKGKVISLDMAKKMAKSDVANLEFLGSQIYGRPIGAAQKAIAENRQTGWGKTLRRLRDYNYLRVMNQVGIAQIPEVGNILGTMGVRAFVQGVPGFKSILASARGKKMDDELLSEIETIWGSGTDPLRHGSEWRWDDVGGQQDVLKENRIDTVLNKGKQFTNHISGMNLINTTLQKWATKAAVQRFVNMAHGSTNKWGKKRLASYGLSSADLELIFENIRGNVKTTDGVFSKTKVQRIGDLADWDDVDAAEKFRMAIFRISRQAIQENDPGNLSRFMSGNLVQTVLQFRSFMLVSIYKQLMRGVHVNDINTWASFGASAFAAGLTYTGHTYLKSVGRDDQKDYLKERLDPIEIGKAAMARSSWGAIIPFAVDNSLGLAGQDPMFSHFRSTGLGSSIFGNPSWSLVQDNVGKGLLGTATNLATEGQATRENIRGVLGFMPFQNAFGVSNVLRNISQEFPYNVK